MPHRDLPVKPTRINTSFVLGPRYHFQSIDEEQMSLLGISPKLRQLGVSIRRLRSGKFNVVLDHSWIRARDSGFGYFMARVTSTHCSTCQQRHKYLCDCTQRSDSEAPAY